MKTNIDSASHSEVTNAEKKYLKAIELTGSNKLPEAEKIFQKVQKVFKQYNCYEKYSECLNKLGYVNINMGKFSEADLYLRTGLKISKKYNQFKNTATITGNIGLIKYYRGFYKEAMELFKEELKINKRIENKYGEMIVIGKIANVYFDTNEYEKAIHFFKVQEELCLKLKNKQSLSYVYGGLAQCYLLMYNFENAFYYLNNQVSLCEEINERLGLSIAFCNIGFAYFRKQDYDLSLSYFYRALDNHKKLNNNRGLIYIYSLLGNVYNNKKDYNNSLKYFKKQLSLSIKLKMHRQEASALGDIGIIYKMRKQYDYAHGVFKKQTNICRKYKLPLPLFFAIDNLGEIYRLTNKNNLSFKYFKEQLTLSKKVFGVRHPNTSTAYRNSGNTFSSAHNYKKALSFYQRALIANSKNFRSYSIMNNPSVEDIFSEEQLYETLRAKALALKKLYEQEENNSLNHLKLSLSTYEFALNLTGKIRTSFREENSKYFMIGNLLSVYEEAIETAVEIYNETGNKEFLEKAFYLSERNKAATLLENMKDSEAKIAANLPEKLIEKEKLLKADIAFKESEKHKELLKGRKSGKKVIEKFDKIIFELKREYNAFIEKLEKNYPEYYNLKSEITDVSIKDVREKLLNGKKIIIEYFAGEKNIYTFKITYTDISATKILKKKSFEKSIKDFRESLTTLSLLNFSFNFKIFCINAHNLYLFLLGNVLNESESITNLIIIPDNVIGYIPFEALITKPALETSGYKNLSYLINNFTVSYGYSTVYLLKNAGEQKNLNQKKIIGFAPDFNTVQNNHAALSNAEENFRSKLAPLNYNETELKEIEKYFPGDYFIKESATKQTFLKVAGKYSIIHLATHCIIDEMHPMFSKICFSQSDNSPEESYLYNYELYNFKLNTRLAVLSACHTGAGKMIKGEGILSVARGFAYSNCSSIVMSLWQVNDLSTSKLMVDFYKELFHGNNIDDSLRAAKLSYLENANDYNASPFFWAPFIMIGNTEAVKFFLDDEKK
ncbi:MAG: CHAT domain-containing protein [Bacteroidota bacterium]|nr:CHAT domain-containing protein [Bacteroidota bacterium]